MDELVNDSTITIPITAKVISKEVFGGQRKVIVLTNTSLLGEIISLAIGSEAKSKQGIVLNPNDRYSDSKDSGYTPSNKQITAIATVATATLAIHEVIELI